MTNTHLSTYLNDHLAGSTTALQLLQHLQSAPLAPELQGVFTELHTDVAADRHELETLMTRLNIPESLPRKAAGWLAEQVTQLKLRIDDPGGGALHLLEAMEVLAVGIHGKYGLWCALAAAAEGSTDLQGMDYERLQQRAVEQRSRVETVRLESARTAFRKEP